MAHQPLAKVSGKKGSGHKKVKHMEIRRAQNGFSTQTHFEQPEMKGTYQEPEENVHENADNMLKHVAGVFGGKMPGKSKKAEAAEEEAEGEEA